MRRADPVLTPEDRRAIEDVTIRYCWALDERDWSDLAQVFIEDAVVAFGSAPPFQSLAKIQAHVAGILEPLDSSQHMVSNHQIESLEGETRSRCYFHAQHTKSGLEGGSNFVVAGSYHDIWVDSPHGWRIRSRRLRVIWTEGNVAVVSRAPVAP